MTGWPEAETESPPPLTRRDRAGCLGLLLALVGLWTFVAVTLLRAWL